MAARFNPYLEGFQNDARVGLAVGVNLVDFPVTAFEMPQALTEPAEVDQVLRRVRELALRILGHLPHAEIALGCRDHKLVRGQVARRDAFGVVVGDRRIIRYLFLFTRFRVFQDQRFEMSAIGTAKTENY